MIKEIKLKEWGPKGKEALIESYKDYLLKSDTPAYGKIKWRKEIYEGVDNWIILPHIPVKPN